MLLAFGCGAGEGVDNDENVSSIRKFNRQGSKGEIDNNSAIVDNKQYVRVAGDHPVASVSMEQNAMCNDIANILNSNKTPINCEIVIPEKYPNLDVIRWEKSDENSELRWNALLRMKYRLNNKEEMDDDAFNSWYSKALQRWAHTSDFGSGVYQASINLYGGDKESTILSFKTRCDSLKDNKFSGRKSIKRNIRLVVGDEGKIDWYFDDLEGLAPFVFQEKVYFMKWWGSPLGALEIYRPIEQYGSEDRYIVGYPICTFEYK